MVKLRVNGTRARTETAVKLRGKVSHPESLPALNLGVRGRGVESVWYSYLLQKLRLFLPRIGKLYIEQH